MKPRTLSSGLVALLLAAHSASAGIGIFSESDGSDCNLTLPNFVPTSIYVLYLGQGGPEATGAEYRIGGMPGTVGTAYTADLITAPASTFNQGNPFGDLATHAVGWPAPQPFDANGNLLLATWTVTNLGAPVSPGTKLRVAGRGGPPVPPCPGAPLISDANFDIHCLEGGEMRVNGGPSCTVAVEEHTWSVVRSLYR